MRAAITVLSLSLSSYIAPVAAQPSELARVLEDYKVNGVVDWEHVKRDAQAADRIKQSATPSGDSAAARPVDAATPPAITFLLRQSFSDIHLFDKPTAVANAKGAEFSWTNDAIANDRIWSVNGMTAVAVSIPGRYSAGPGDVSLLGVSFAPYAQLKREAHSNTAKKDIDTGTFGGSVEVGFDTFSAGRHYFRLSVSNVDDEIKGASYLHTMGEWIPVNGTYCIGAPCGLIPKSMLGSGPQIIYSFQPELKVQHDKALEDSKPVAFSGQSGSLRIGPEVTLLAKPFGPNLVFLDGNIDLNNLLAKATYHYAWETYSDSAVAWFDTSLTYNIGKDGHLGLTASYQKGKDEEAGAKTEVFKVSLTGKF